MLRSNTWQPSASMAGWRTHTADSDFCMRTKVGRPMQFVSTTVICSSPIPTQLIVGGSNAGRVSWKKACQIRHPARQDGDRNPQSQNPQQLEEEQVEYVSFVFGYSAIADSGGGNHP